MAEKEILTQSAAMTEEEKKKNFNLLHEIMQWILDKIRNRGIITQKVEQKLEELENDLAGAIEQGEITEKTLNEVLELVKDLDGKIDSITPENVDEVMSKFIDDADEIIHNIDAEYVQSGGKLTEKMRQALLGKLENSPEQLVKGFGKDADKIGDFLISEDFDKDFQQNANIIRQANSNDKNRLLIEYKGLVFTAVADFDKDNGKNTLNIKLENSKYTADEIKAKPDDFHVIEKGERYNAERELAKAFCDNNGFHYLATRTPLEKLTPQQNFIRKHFAKSVSAENIENVVDNEGNLHIRDVDTGEMLVASSDNGKISITYYSDSENIADTNGKHRVLGSWETDNDHIHADFTLAAVGVEVNNLLHSDEMQEYLAILGVTKEMQDKTFAHESDNEWELVTSQEGIAKVNALYEQCKKAIDAVEEVKGASADYSIQKVENRTSTFINVSDGTNTMSFSFDKDGNPNTINFKDGDSKKFECVRNIKANTINDSYVKYQALDRTSKSFEQMQTIMDAALEEMQTQQRMADKQRKDVGHDERG